MKHLLLITSFFIFSHGLYANTLTVVNNLDNGAGSLRDQIAAANAGDTILFASSTNGTNIVLTAANDIDISKALVIIGNGQDNTIIDGNNNARIFDITNADSVSINHLTIQNGLAFGAVNDAYGGGVFVDNTILRLNFCKIQENESKAGGGIYLKNSSGANEVNHCEILGNKSEYGGGVNIFISSLTISNTLIAGNVASDGTGFGQSGGIDKTGTGSSNIINSTISGNFTDGIGGGINGNFTVVNSIVWGNMAQSSSSNEINNIATTSYTLIKGENLTGTGNINGIPANDPLFVNPIAATSTPTTAGDYRLQCASPVVEMGNNAANSSSLDLDATARIIDADNNSTATVDFGAYERLSTVPATSIDTRTECAGFVWIDGNTYTTNNATATHTIIGGAASGCDSIVTLNLTILGNQSHTVLNSNDAGTGSLRQAVIDACPGDTILFDPSTNGTNIVLTGADIDISKALVIIGNGQDNTIIDGNANARIFEITDADSVSINHLTIQNGSAFGTGSNGSGGGIFVDNTMLQLNFCTLQENECNSGGGVFINNSSGANEINHCKILGNQATYGGGIYIANLNLTVSNTLVTGNVAASGPSGNGGGIYNDITGNLNIINSSITGNFAVEIGGGINGDFTAVNSIIWGNVAISASYNEINGTVTTTYTLIKGQNLPGAGNVDGTNPANDPLFVNPIAATSTPTTAGDYRLQCASPVIEIGNNADNTSSLDLDANARVIDADNNSTATIDFGAYERLSTVPATSIDTRTECAGFVWIDGNTYTTNNTTATHTIVGGAASGCDSIVTLNLTILGNQSHTVLNSNDAGPGSLRQAVIDACPGDTILFAPSTNGTNIVLAGADIDISKALVIIGNGQDNTIIDGDNNARIFNITNADSISINHLTIQNGRAFGSGNNGSGGGILVVNTILQLNFCTIQENESINGGGVYIANSSGANEINHCEILGNQANFNGGGIYIANSNLTISNTLIAGNVAFNGSLGYGGGIDKNGTGNLNIINSNISGNFAGSFGGGVNGSFTAVNSIIWGNVASNSISNEIGNGTATTTYTLIKGRTATGMGDLDGTDPANDPLFVNPIAATSTPTTAGDYRLQCASPVVEMGNNTANTSSLDLDANARIIDADNNSTATIDFGAYERLSTAPATTIDTRTECAGFVWIDGNTYTTNNTTATHTIVGGAASGCDSIVTLNLTILGNQSHTVVNSNDAGPGSLRQAVIDACPGDTILFAPSTNGTNIVLSAANDIDISKALVIIGNGKDNTIIDGNANARIFEITDADSVSINHLTIQNGLAFGGGSNGNAGGIFIENTILQLNFCKVQENESSRGGGVYIGNSSGANEINHCEILGNQTRIGGGINITNSNLTVINTLIAGNVAYDGPGSGDGGGIYNDGTASINIINSSVSGNFSGQVGGGIRGNFTSVNSIIWGNVVQGSSSTNEISGTVTTTYTLIKGRVASGMGDLDGTNTANDPLFVNPIAATSTATTAGDYRLQCASPVLEMGDNAANSSSFDLDANARIIDADNNSTATIDFGAYERLSTVPATSIDTRTECAGFVWIDGNTYTANNTTATHTIVGGAASGCDSVVTLNLTILGNQSHTVVNSNDAGVGSLRQAVIDACPGDTILFDPSTNGTNIVLAGTDIAFSKALVIIGNGKDNTIIDGNANARIFEITDADSVSINHLTIQNGQATGGGSNGDGGGMFVVNTLLQLNFCTVQGNGSFNGGGVYIRNSSGTNEINHCEILGNQATYGGGILIVNSNLSLSNTLIAGNVASNGLAGNGGGISKVGSENLNILNSSIIGNLAVGYTGGISGDFTAVNSIVWGNVAQDNPSSNEIDGTATTSYTLIKGRTATGSGDLDGTNPANDPLFVNPIAASITPTTAGDYRLQCASPVIEIGSNAANTSSLDLDANARVVDADDNNTATIDFGAYERAMDIENPVITCPSDVTINTDAGLCTSTASIGTATASDNCGVQTLVSNAPTNFPIGNTNVRWIATDAVGNADTCFQIVTVIDNQNPVITCPNDVTINTDAGLCTSTAAIGTATASDNCGVQTLVSNAPTNFPIGNTNVRWIATDATGNADTCFQIVTVIDNQNPVITCPSDVTINTDAGLCTSTASIGTATASDNCGVQTLVSNAPTNFPIGNTNVRWIATDAVGNADTCFQIVTVIDNQNPVITCPSDVTINTDAGLCTSTAAIGTATASDNCGVQTLVSNAPTNFPIGNTNVRWIATDTVGNADTCFQIVTVIDNQNPVITCVSDQTIVGDESCSIVLADYTVLSSATDNCTSNLVLSQDPAPGTVLSGVGFYTIELSTSDTQGNISSCSFDVEIIDTIAPLVECLPNQVEVLSSFCDFTLPDYSTITTFSDNCDDDVFITQSPEAGTSYHGVQEFPVNLSFEDFSGNITSCSFMVTVQTDQLNTGCLEDIFITTLITPNGDGKNDTWEINEIDYIQYCTVSVFNRWGLMVHEQMGYESAWDGRSNGIDLPDGDYYYVIECDGVINYTGPITILRTK